MTWGQYTKRRLSTMVDGSKFIPSQKNIIRKIVVGNRIWKVEEIVFEMCKRTKIDRSSIEQNIEGELDKLVAKGSLVCVQPGYYRCK